MAQDDSMLSTPSSNADADESLITNPNHDNDNDIDADGDEMFPAMEQTGDHTRPRTPQNDHLNAAAPGELSPPRSQTNAHDRDTVMHQDEDLDLSPTNPNLGVAGGTSTITAGAASSGLNGAQDTEWKAGYGWKNKKAQMEMHKALEGFSDKDFNIKQYGDVLAHRIGVEAGQQ